MSTELFLNFTNTEIANARATIENIGQRISQLVDSAYKRPDNILVRDRLIEATAKFFPAYLVVNEVQNYNITKLNERLIEKENYSSELEEKLFSLTKDLEDCNTTCSNFNYPILPTGQSGVNYTFYSIIPTIQSSVSSFFESIYSKMTSYDFSVTLRPYKLIAQDSIGAEELNSLKISEKPHLIDDLNKLAKIGYEGGIQKLLHDKIDQCEKDADITLKKATRLVDCAGGTFTKSIYGFCDAEEVEENMDKFYACVRSFNSDLAELISNAEKFTECMGITNE